MSASASFTPPHRHLMGPGPSDVHPRVLSALARPTIGHLDPCFIELMESIKGLLQYAFQTRNALTFPVSGPGTVGMETCLANLLEPGDTIVICVNGAFGGRLVQMAERMGAQVIRVDDRWGEAVDPHKLEDALRAHPEASVVAFVHAETSTGVLSNAAVLADLAREYGCLSIVDTVTSLGGSELRVDDWGLDAVYSGTQKCLSAPPGLSPVTFSDRAMERIKARKTPVQSWFMDLSLVMSYWGTGEGAQSKRSYHHTAPINALYGLHEALLSLQEEGLENAWQRHSQNHRLLKHGLERLKIDFVVKPDDRLPQLNTVWIPAGADDQEVRDFLLTAYDLEIGAGLGELAGKVWRIGLMGYSSRKQNIELCLEALDDALNGE